MEGILPLTAWADDGLLPNAPAFVRPFPDMQGVTDNPCELFDWWCPERTGDADLDYATGQQHCLTAIAYARAVGASNVVANVIGAMYRHGAGPIEHGFIDVLARKATYGRIPEPVTAEMASATTHLCGRSEEELRFGESEAREYLDLARLLGCPSIVNDLLVNAVNLEMGYGALTFIWTVCGAAVVGSLN